LRRRIALWQEAGGGPIGAGAVGGGMDEAASTGGRMLILGATSLIGRYLTPRLATMGGDVTALSRSPRAAQDGVRWVLADLQAPDSLAAVGRVDTVYSLSPIWLLTPQALAALGALGMRRLVAFSSTSVLTKAASGSSAERRVAEALARGEAAIEAHAAVSGMGWTILRPTLIYAEGQDGNVSRLAGLIRRCGVLPLPGNGAGRRQPVHAEDLARLAEAVMARPATNRAYAAPGGETLSYRTMVERIFAGLGRRPLILSVPEPVIRFGYALAGPLLPGSTAQMIERIAEDLVFDGEDAQRDFAWTPRAFHPRFGGALSSAETTRNSASS